MLLQVRKSISQILSQEIWISFIIDLEQYFHYTNIMSVTISPYNFYTNFRKLEFLKTDLFLYS